MPLICHWPWPVCAATRLILGVWGISFVHCHTRRPNVTWEKHGWKSTTLKTSWDPWALVPTFGTTISVPRFLQDPQLAHSERLFLFLNTGPDDMVRPTPNAMPHATFPHAQCRDLAPSLFS